MIRFGNDYQTWARVALALLAGAALTAAVVLYRAERSGPVTSRFNAVGVELPYSKSVDSWIVNSPAKETQHGTSLKDQFHGVGGDVLIGGQGDDTYTLWDTGNLVVESPGEGVDTVESYSNGATVLADNVENLTLKGDRSNHAGGNALDNIITAGDTGATLDGGGGNDVLVGGRGPDIFQIRAGNGSDAIIDFTQGTDKVRLGGYTINSFDKVRATMRQVGADTVIRLDKTEKLILRGVSAKTLTAGDFQLPIDMSKLRLSFTDEFSTLRLRAQGGIWIPNLAEGGMTDHGHVDEQQVYVDAGYAGSATNPLGINPFAVSPDGVLSIIAAPIEKANAAALGRAAYSSGLLSSKTGFSQQYGYFEIRAALPKGQGFLPEFWLMPATGGWPPEIDVMESLGRDPGMVYMTMHDIGGVRKGSAAYFDHTERMHTYGLNWTKEKLTWYVDEMEVAQQPAPATFRQEFYVIINLAIGNAWAGKVDSSTGIGAFKIDYLRVYANAETVSRSVHGVKTPLTGAGAQRLSVVSASRSDAR
ncbi:family 16 glycosylhydrolase [Sphingomonas sp. UYP23]